MSAAIRTRSEGKWIKGEKHSSKVELGKNIANTITSASKDSLVVLGETRLRIRRLTPRELFRLMNVDEEYIDKMLESGVSKSSLQIYTGTETRNPDYAGQHLPKYLSYFVMRYLESAAPGRN